MPLSYNHPLHALRSRFYGVPEGLRRNVVHYDDNSLQSLLHHFDLDNHQLHNFHDKL